MHCHRQSQRQAQESATTSSTGTTSRSGTATTCAASLSHWRFQGHRVVYMHKHCMARPASSAAAQRGATAAASTAAPSPAGGHGGTTTSSRPCSTHKHARRPGGVMQRRKLADLNATPQVAREPPAGCLQCRWLGPQHECHEVALTETRYVTLCPSR